MSGTASIGSCWSETAPTTTTNSDANRTSKRYSRANATIRFMLMLLANFFAEDHGFEVKSAFGDDGFGSLESCEDLRRSLYRPSEFYGLSLEHSRARSDEYNILAVELLNRVRRNSKRFLAERGWQEHGCKHIELESRIGVCHFTSNLGRACLRIKDVADIGDAAL